VATAVGRAVSLVADSEFASGAAETEGDQLARTGRDIVLKPRQVGFSILELARDLWLALVNPGTNVQVIVHDGDQAVSLRAGGCASISRSRSMIPRALMQALASQDGVRFASPCAPAGRWWVRP